MPHRAHFGHICGVDVFSLQILRENSIMPEQQMVNVQFPFQQSTSTQYCIWSVIASMLNHNLCSSSLILFFHVPSQRDQGD